MGYGDEIMVTGYAKVLKQKYPDHQIVAGNKQKGIVTDSIIFNNNPYIKRFSELRNMKTIWIDSYSGHRPYFIKETEDKYYWNMNYRVKAGDLFFSKEEKQFASSIISSAKEWWGQRKNNKFKKIIFLEPSRIKTSKNNASINRSWGNKKWASFLDLHKNEYLFLQSVFRDSDQFDGIYNFTSGFRDACAVLNQCDLVVGGEGGFTHAAGALNKKGLFIYGGWIDPNITGYSVHNNVYVDIEGSPCGMKILCEHCKKCNEIMTVEMISKKFTEMISF